MLRMWLFAVACAMSSSSAMARVPHVVQQWDDLGFALRAPLQALDNRIPLAKRKGPFEFHLSMKSAAFS